MAGAYKLGFQATGSQDPYGLRRAIRCINEIVWGLELDLDLGELLAYITGRLDLGQDSLDSLLTFIKQRTLIQLKEKEYSHDMVELALSVTGAKPLQSLRLLQALTEAKKEEWFTSLVNSAVRVKNILAKDKSEKKTVVPALFVKEAERALFKAVSDAKQPVENAMSRNDWNGLMNVLSELSPAVSSFFNDVMVMDDDPNVRSNRLSLLNMCEELFLQVGDLSKAK